jgi:hypothetical protein
MNWRKRHAPPPGTPCRNCGTLLRGPWCDQCGQLGEDFHRSAHHLIGEVLEGLFDADGRLFTTVPRLVLFPGRLTRAYIEGKRAPQIPPFRLFLTMLLILFLVGSIGPGALHAPDIRGVSNADRQHAKVELETGLATSNEVAIAGWLKTRLPAAIDHPDAVFAAMGEWAHRFAFLTLPISAILLSLIFAFRRDTYLFDHLIFSMHSLSFQGLLVSLVMLIGGLTGDFSGLLLLASPIHLYVHMRDTYGTGRAGTIVRMSVLFVASTVAFGLLLLGLVVIGLNAAAG